MPNQKLTRLFALTLAVTSCVAGVARATPAGTAQHAIDKGLNYLKTQQKPDGGWQRPGDFPAITALVLKSYMGDKNYNANQPFIKKGFDKLLSYQKPSGGIYRDLIANYSTAIAISTLAASKQYQPQEQKALAFLRRLQWGDNIDQVANPKQKVPPSDPRYGGFGYGKRSRPDGSNVQFALDALHDAGIKPGDPAYKAAIVFETRLQNNSETNNQPWAGNDGGFIYTDANGGDSEAGEYTGPDGKKMFRSYGSMTYAGLKSMIYAGLSKNDPRVKAAWGWITHNWTFDANPGIDQGQGKNAQSGLYYYFYTASRALHAYGQPIVTDSSGKKHDWRAELIAKLTSLQMPNGSWQGERQWMESDPTEATTLAVMSLETAKEDLAQHPVK